MKLMRNAVGVGPSREFRGRDDETREIKGPDRAEGTYVEFKAAAGGI